MLCAVLRLPRLLRSRRSLAACTVVLLLLLARSSGSVSGSRRGAAVRRGDDLAVAGSLAYISAGNVWLSDNGGSTTQLTEDGAATGVRFTPGGTALLVEERERRLVLRRDGSVLQVGSGAWLPDDSGVATAGGDGALVLRAMNGSSLQTLVPAEAQVEFQPVAWSPDGETLAFDRVELGARNIPVAQSLWLVGRGGGLRELLPPADTWPQALGWSPDGRWLAVFRGPAEACVSCRVDGQELDAVEVASGRALAAGTVVRPDGYCFTANGSALIASVGAGRESYRDKQLVRLDLQSGAVTAIAGGGSAVAIQPACAPQGGAVAFTLGPALRGEPFSGLDAAHGYPQALLSGRRLQTSGASRPMSGPPAGYAEEAPRWAGPGALLFVRWVVGADAEPQNAALWLEASDGSAAREIVPALGTTAPPAPYFGDDGFADLFDWHP